MHKLTHSIFSSFSSSKSSQICLNCIYLLLDCDAIYFILPIPHSLHFQDQQQLQHSNFRCCQELLPHFELLLYRNQRRYFCNYKSNSIVWFSIFRRIHKEEVIVLKSKFCLQEIQLNLHFYQFRQYGSLKLLLLSMGVQFFPNQISNN